MELLQLFLASIIVLVTGTAVFLTLIGFFPHVAAQSQAVIERSPGRALLVGLVNLFFFGTLILTLLALGENVAQIFFIPALILLFLLSAATMFGLLGLALLLGQRLWPEKQPAKRHTYAAVLMLLASSAPFLGWFALMPLLLIVALGSCVMLMVERLQHGQNPSDEQEENPVA